MNDRFRFRAYITSTVDRDTPEEKEVSFYINNVAVYRYGDIGFSQDQLSDALVELDLTEKQKNEIAEDIAENSYCEDYEWFSIEFGEKEQCTGLKDKNGKLIYEGDILAVSYIDPIFMQPVNMEVNNDVAYVESYKGCFVAHYPEKQRKYLYDYENIAEVIGNIHENAELLEIVDVAED